jgi:hypothetical protein
MRMASYRTFCDIINFVGFAKTALPTPAPSVTSCCCVGGWRVFGLFAIPSTLQRKRPVAVAGQAHLGPHPLPFGCREGPAQRRGPCARTCCKLTALPYRFVGAPPSPPPRPKTAPTSPQGHLSPASASSLAELGYLPNALSMPCLLAAPVSATHKGTLIPALPTAHHRRPGSTNTSNLLPSLSFSPTCGLLLPPNEARESTY